MQGRRFLYLFVLIGLSFVAQSQGPGVIQDYINTYREIAIEEMHRTGVPAAIKLAQGIHETTAGTSELVRKSNNHFGIKCKSNWTGESVKHTDDAPHECFRKYDDPFQSYRDHSDFLKNSSRYASLFTLDPLDYQGWANGLKKAGYATNPRYPQIIIKLVETWNLQDYTLIALGKKNAEEGAIVASRAPQIRESTVPVVAVAVPLDKAYPAHEFRINNTRVIYASSGTSCLSLARQYNIPLARLFEFNDMDETENLLKNQLVYLQRKRKSGESVVHIVKNGETLWDIAQEEGIRLESLLEYNRLESYMQPAAGEQLYLRTKAPAAPKLAKHSAQAE